MEQDNKPLSEKERLEVRQIALIQAIADNKAAKRVAENKAVFVIGLVVICLNLVASIIALFLGCRCETDTPWWHWLLLGIYIAFLLAVFIFNLIDYIRSQKKKSDEDIDQKANSGNLPLDKVLQIYKDDTEKIDKQKKATRRIHIITAIITIVSTILVITVLSLF